MTSLVTDENPVGVEELREHNAALQQQVAELEQQTTDLQQRLRRARRGYVSKRAVQDVIDYGRRRNFWCADAQRYAEQHGVVGPDLIRLEVDLGVYGTATLDVDADQFDALEDDEAKKNWLSSQIQISVNVGGRSTASGQISPTVNSYEEVIEEPSPATDSSSPRFAIDPVPGYNFRYVSAHGRAAHLVSDFNVDRPYARALCGAAPSGGTWRETSPQADLYSSVRTEHDGAMVFSVCVDCQDRAAALGR